MKQQIKKLFSIAILIAIALLTIYYIKVNLSDFKQLSLVNPIYILVVIILSILSYFFVGLITKNILLSLNVKLKGTEAFGISIVTGFYNLITPFRGGMATRAVYLKKKHNFSYLDFLSTLAASYILIFLVASFLGLVSTLLIYKNSGIFSWFIFLIFLAMFLSLLFIVIFSPKFPTTRYRWVNGFVRVANGWHLIKNNKKVILTVSFFGLIQSLLLAFMFYFELRIFGIEIDLIKCIFLCAITSLSMLVSVTPGNLGVGEAITVFSANTIGINPVQSLSVVLLGRAISFLFLLILGPIFSYILLKYKPKQNGGETK